MRISSPALLSVLIAAACAPQSAMPAGESIECAIGAGAPFAADCILERRADGELVVHHPDGAFYRLRYDESAGTVASADGAEALVETQSGSAQAAEFSIGSARYRIDRALLSRAAR